jgi:NAD(P)-dependent dehydrogenase (short-subunit alcohol dehydrogenase family)
MMANQIRLDNRVAIVTGAGRGLGRSHALLMAARGAKVLVNDVGAELDGAGADTGVADGVVKEIREADGKAAASHDSVSHTVRGDCVRLICERHRRAAICQSLWPWARTGPC